MIAYTLAAMLALTPAPSPIPASAAPPRTGDIAASTADGSLSVTRVADRGTWCVRATTLAAAWTSRTRVHRRECLTERQWRDRGVTFAHVSRIEQPTVD